MSTLFSRSTKGDPAQVIKDVLSKMTFIEVVCMGRELNIDPQALSDWAHGIQQLKKPAPGLPFPANDNPPAQTSVNPVTTDHLNSLSPQPSTPQT